MTQRDEAVYIGDMLDAARKTVELVHGKTRADYDADETLRLALAHLAQIIGEAARLVSPTTRQSSPAIPWREIVAMRHKLVHEYFRLDEDVLWDVVTRHVPALVAELEKIVPPTPPTP